MDRPDSEESSAKASVLGGPAKPPAAAGGAKMSILGGAPSPSPSPSITSLLGGVRRGATAGGAGGAGGAGEAEAQRRFAHVCAVCSQGFRTRSELKTHAATHNVAKQYLCSHPTCNLTFGLKHNRDRHEATQHGHNKTLRKRHAKPPAVYCEICNKKFRCATATRPPDPGRVPLTPSRHRHRAGTPPRSAATRWCTTASASSSATFAR